MSTGKKIFLWLLISPFLLFFIFSIIWDPNWFRGQADPHLEDIEGHQVDFVSIEHSLLEPGYLEVQDITIKGEFINGSLGTLIIDGSIREALNKNIVIREITLRDSNLQLDMQAFQQWQENKTQEDTGEEIDIEVESEAENDGFTINNIYIDKVALENVIIKDVSALQQFFITGLNLTLRKLNIAENAEIVIGTPRNPVYAELDINQIKGMSSPGAKVLAEVTATKDLITLKELYFTTEKSRVTANGLVRNPKANAEIQLILQDSQLVLEEFAPMLREQLSEESSILSVDVKGTLDLSGELYAKGQLDNLDSLMSTLASKLNLMLDTGSSQLDIAGELSSELLSKTASPGDNEADEKDIMLSPKAHVQLRINDSHINLAELEPFLEDLPVKPSGDLKLSGLLNTTGDLQDSNALLAALNGEIELVMKDANLQGIDVNNIVSSFKESKETDLVDVGSFLLTGPIGILASNLMDLGGAAKFEGNTKIPQLDVKGKMENGSINLHNTALATDQYRLAFDGAINPGKGTFEDFTFAILDEAGCADIKQTLNGEFTQPTSAVAKSLLDSALSPVTGLVSSIKNTAVKCTPFYEGEVQHPKN